jgi:hypothetical protein
MRFILWSLFSIKDAAMKRKVVIARGGDYVPEAISF